MALPTVINLMWWLLFIHAWHRTWSGSLGRRGDIHGAGGSSGVVAGWGDGGVSVASSSSSVIDEHSMRSWDGEGRQDGEVVGVVVVGEGGRLDEDGMDGWGSASTLGCATAGGSEGSPWGVSDRLTDGSGEDCGDEGSGVLEESRERRRLGSSSPPLRSSASHCQLFSAFLICFASGVHSGAD
jgi:hypothetical protein